MNSTDIDQIIESLRKSNFQDKKKIFEILRNEIPIHSIENDWNTKA